MRRVTTARERALALAEFLDGNPLAEELRDFAPAVRELRRLVEELAPDPERVALLGSKLRWLVPQPTATGAGSSDSGGSGATSSAGSFPAAARRAKTPSPRGQAARREKP